MKKEKVLYICGRKYFKSKISDWYESFKNVCQKDVSMEKNKIETPYAMIEFIYRRPLFTWKYDFVLNADKQDDDAKLFAIGIGKDY